MEVRQYTFAVKLQGPSSWESRLLFLQWVSGLTTGLNPEFGLGIVTLLGAFCHFPDYPILIYFDFMNWIISYSLLIFLAPIDDYFLYHSNYLKIRIFWLAGHLSSPL